MFPSYTCYVFMAWLARLDAKLKVRDARYEAWLDRRLSPVFDTLIALYPLLALGLIGVMFLL